MADTNRSVSYTTQENATGAAEPTLPASAVPRRFLLREYADPLQAMLPALADALAMLDGDLAEGPVRELEARNFALGRQAVLHVRNRRVRHEQRAADLQQRRR